MKKLYFRTTPWYFRTTPCPTFSRGHAATIFPSRGALPRTAVRSPRTPRWQSTPTNRPAPRAPSSACPESRSAAAGPSPPRQRTTSRPGSAQTAAARPCGSPSTPASARCPTEPRSARSAHTRGQPPDQSPVLQVITLQSLSVRFSPPTLTSLRPSSTITRQASSSAWIRAGPRALHTDGPFVPTCSTKARNLLIALVHERGRGLTVNQSSGPQPPPHEERTS